LVGVVDADFEEALPLFLLAHRQFLLDCLDQGAHPLLANVRLSVQYILPCSEGGVSKTSKCQKRKKKTSKISKTSKMSKTSKTSTGARDC
jgi:hypothetical protein